MFSPMIILLLSLCLVSWVCAMISNNSFLLTSFLAGIRNYTLPGVFSTILDLTEDVDKEEYIINVIRNSLGTVTVFDDLNTVPKHGILFIIAAFESQIVSLIDSEYFLYQFDSAVVILQDKETPEFISESRFWGSAIKFFVIVFGNTLDKAYVHFPYPTGPQNISTYVPSKKIYDSTNSSRLLYHMFKKHVINMHLQPLKISMFERRITSEKYANGTFYGFDASIMKVMSQAMNFSAVIAGPFPETSGACTFGPTFPNGTYCGSIGDLILNRSDIALNSMFLKQYTSENYLVFTTSMIYDKLCVVVPSSQLVPQWKVLFLCFTPVVWLFVIFTYFAAIFIGYLMEKVTKPTKPNKFLSVLFKVCSIFVQHPLPHLPRRISERVFCMTLLVGCLIVGTSFQSSLLNLLTKPNFEKQINTLEDLDQSGLIVYCNSPSLADTFSGSDSQIFRNLANKFIVSLDTKNFFVQMVTKRNIATVGRKHDLKITIGTKFMGEYGSLLHIVEDCPRTYHLSYPMAKWSPFIDSINTVLGRILSGGLIYSIHLNLGYMAGKFKYRTRQDLATSMQTVPEAFDLETVQFYFSILFLGYTASSVCFLLEIVFGRLIKADSSIQATKIMSDKKTVIKNKRRIKPKTTPKELLGPKMSYQYYYYFW